jgi:hypothetical protein
LISGSILETASQVKLQQAVSVEYGTFRSRADAQAVILPLRRIKEKYASNHSLRHAHRLVATAVAAW